jgi:hypothetical protein
VGCCHRTLHLSRSSCPFLLLALNFLFWYSTFLSSSSSTPLSPFFGFVVSFFFFFSSLLLLPSEFLISSLLPSPPCFLLSRPPFISASSPKRVLELGSGTGLVGIVAGLKGAEEMILTDQARLLRLLNYNIETNVKKFQEWKKENGLQEEKEIKIKSEELFWGNGNPFPHKVLLSSSPSTFPPLLFLALLLALLLPSPSCSFSFPFSSSATYLPFFLASFILFFFPLSSCISCLLFALPLTSFPSFTQCWVLTGPMRCKTSNLSFER